MLSKTKNALKLVISETDRELAEKACITEQSDDINFLNWCVHQLKDAYGATVYIYKWTQDDEEGYELVPDWMVSRYKKLCVENGSVSRRMRNENT